MSTIVKPNTTYNTLQLLRQCSQWKRSWLTSLTFILDDNTSTAEAVLLLISKQLATEDLATVFDMAASEGRNWIYLRFGSDGQFVVTDRLDDFEHAIHDLGMPIGSNLYTVHEFLAEVFQKWIESWGYKCNRIVGVDYIAVCVSLFWANTNKE